MYIFDISLADFEEKVIQASNEKPVLVDLWADWCPPCVIIAPILKEIINERNGEIILAKLEVDEGDNMKIAGQYQVRGFPTVMLIRNGVEIDRFSGAKPKYFIDDFIDSGLSE